MLFGYKYRRVNNTEKSNCANRKKGDSKLLRWRNIAHGGASVILNHHDNGELSIKTMLIIHVKGRFETRERARVCTRA